MHLLLFLLICSCYAQEEHFLDVKQLVKGTIEAMAKLPQPVPSNNGTSIGESETPSPDLYRLLQLPTDIITKLAADAGYIDEPSTTTYGPWIVRKHKKSSEEEEEEEEVAFKQESEEKPKKKKRKSKKQEKKSSEDNLIPLSQFLPKPLDFKTLPQMPGMMLPSTMSDPMISSPLLPQLPPLQQSPISDGSRYAYQQIVHPDGKTYYQQVLLYPAAARGAPTASIGLPQLSLQPSISSFQTLAPPQRPRIVDESRKAEYTAPTFPPPVNMFTISQITRKEENKPYPIRFVQPQVRSERIEEKTTRPPIPMNDDMVVDVSHKKSFNTAGEALYTTEQPSPQQQNKNNLVFNEEAQVRAPSKKTNVKEKQASPLRIRAIDRLNTDTNEQNSETELVQEKEEKPKTNKRLKFNNSLKVKKHKKPVKLSSSEEASDVSSMSISSTQKSTGTHQLSQRETVAPLAKMSSDQFREQLSSLPTDSEEMMRESEEAIRMEKKIGKIPRRAYSSKIQQINTSKMPLNDEMSTSAERTISKQLDRIGAEQVKPKKKSRNHKSFTKNDYDSKNERNLARFTDSDEVEETTVEPTTKKIKRRKRVRTTPSTTTTTTTTTTEASFEDSEEYEVFDDEEEEVTTTTTTTQPTTTTTQPKKRKIKKYRKRHHVNEKQNEKDGEIEESTTERPHHKRRRKHGRKTTTMPHTSFPTKQHCINIRSFARQFGMIDVSTFATEHCSFIENYYPDLQCDQVEEYVQVCKQYYH